MDDARKSLAKSIAMSPEVAASVPDAVKFVMAKDLTSSPMSLNSRNSSTSFPNARSIHCQPRSMSPPCCRSIDLMTMTAPLDVVSAPARLGPGPDGSPPPAHITVRGLHKQFNGTVIYENFDLDIPRGKFVSVFGARTAAGSRR